MNILRTPSLCLPAFALLLAILTACAPNSAASQAGARAGETPEPPAESNLLQNPGFEDFPYLARPWETLVHANPESYEFAIHTDAPRSGQHAAHIRRVRDEPWAGLVQIVRADEAEPRALTASVWLNLDAVDDHVIFYVEMRKTGEMPVLERLILRRSDAGNGWKRFQLRTPPVTGRTRLKFGVEMYGAGEVWIDDASLAWVSPGTRQSAPGLRH